ncbi:hypothetical protein ACLOJK_017241 [Asimina triloba]
MVVSKLSSDGNECEYRHSEGARMNPRDCWYWLNGNCSNPKCSFRHLPFEGFPGTPGGTSGPSFPPSQAPAAAQIPPAPTVAAYGSNKQMVPCIYFQKGHCLKGDRCPFMHGSLPVSNSTPQQTLKPPKSVGEAPTSIQKATASLERGTSQLKIPQVHAIKPVEAPMMSKPAVKADILPSNGITIKNNMETAAFREELSRPKLSNPPLAIGNAGGKPLGHSSQMLDEPLQNGREAGEFLGESSPGFDVLVDDEIEDPDYYHPDDEYGRTAGSGRRHLNAASEFDYELSADQGSLGKFDREPYNDVRNYDRHRRSHDRFGREHRRPSSDRGFERSAIMERKGLAREESPGRIDKADLRYRLSKQKRVDGRSATSPDRHSGFYQWDDRHTEEQRYAGRSRRDQSHLPPDASISSRLQGRIKLPGRHSPDNPSDLHPDREAERRQNYSRSSPGKPISYQGRHHDKIRWTQEDTHTETRTIRGRPVKRDESDTLNFAGPKSLAELKGVKASDSSEGLSINDSDSIPSKTQVALAKKNMRLEKIGHQESDGSLLFEGPKPLSEILKRKREESTSSKDSSGGENSSKRERADPTINSGTAVTEAPIVGAMEPGKDGHVTSRYEEPRVTTETMKLVGRKDGNDEGPDTAEGTELVYEIQSSARKEVLEDVDGMMIENIEDQEAENSDQRDGEYEFDVEGGYENTELEEEYLDDDDDGDDFSRRMGAMLS